MIHTQEVALRSTPPATAAWLAIGPQARQAIARLKTAGSPGEGRSTPERLGTRPPLGGDPLILTAQSAYEGVLIAGRSALQGCVVEASRLRDRPRAALKALRGHLGDAPLIVVGPPGPTITKCAGRLNVSLLSHPGAAPVGTAAGAREALTHPAPADGRLAPSVVSSVVPSMVAPIVAPAPTDPATDPILARFFEYLADPKALEEAVVSALAARSGARRISLLLRDFEEGHLVLAGGRGIAEHLLARVRLPVGEGLPGRVLALGRPLQGAGASGGLREYPGRSYLLLPLGARPPVGVACLTGFENDRHPQRLEREHLESLCRSGGLAILSARRLAQAQAESTQDPLTHLPNRRAFERALARETERLRRTRNTLGVALLDVDRFKAVNDRLGHDAGDRVLHAVARRLQRAFRQADLVARWGGEEFAVLLPDLGAEGPGRAQAALERALHSIQVSPVALGGGQPPVEITVSGGLAVSGPGRLDGVALLRAADAALLLAKARGRNRLETAPPV